MIKFVKDTTVKFGSYIKLGSGFSLGEDANGLPELSVSGAPVSTHVLATTTAIGSEHTVSGLAVGKVLRAIAADDVAFQYLIASDIPSLDAAKITTGTFSVGLVALTTDGDMIYQSSGVLTRLPIGGANTVLLSNASIPNWGAITSAYTTGTFPPSAHNQNASTIEAGTFATAISDTSYQITLPDAAIVPALIIKRGGTGAQGYSYVLQYQTSAGGNIFGVQEGGAVVALAFEGSGASLTSLNPAELSSAVPVNKGGTAKTSWVNWRIPIITGAGAFDEIAVGAAGTVLTGNGTTSAPTFQALGLAAHSIDDHDDVDMTSVAVGHVLKYVTTPSAGWLVGFVDWSELVGTQPAPIAHNQASTTITMAAGFTVVGKATTGGGQAVEIAAAADGVLRRSGSGNLAFGSLVTNSYGNNTVTYGKIQQSSATGFAVMARTATGAGNYAEINASSDFQVLRRSGAALGFGSINLASTNAVTGTLPVGNGGTGVVSPTTGNLYVGAGSSAMTALAPGAAAGYVRSNGSAWVRASGIAAADVVAGIFPTGTWSFAVGAVFRWMGAVGTGQARLTVVNSAGYYEWTSIPTSGTDPGYQMRIAEATGEWGFNTGKLLVNGVAVVGGGSAVTSVSGTTNCITVSPTTGAVVVNIHTSYVGQTTITTLGTIGTGTWQGTAIASGYIGAHNQAASTITAGTFNTTVTTAGYAIVASDSTGTADIFLLHYGTTQGAPQAERYGFVVGWSDVRQLACHQDGSITAGSGCYFAGSGSGLTNIPTASLTPGTFATSSSWKFAATSDLEFAVTAGQTFTAQASNRSIAITQATAGADAYMTFHIANDYAGYFGLGGAENDFVVGGWSFGSVRYRVLHEGNYASILTGAFVLTGPTGSQTIERTTPSTPASTYQHTLYSGVPIASPWQGAVAYVLNPYWENGAGGPSNPISHAWRWYASADSSTTTTMRMQVSVASGGWTNVMALAQNSIATFYSSVYFGSHYLSWGSGYAIVAAYTGDVLRLAANGGGSYVQVNISTFHASGQRSHHLGADGTEWDTLYTEDVRLGFGATAGGTIYHKQEYNGGNSGAALTWNAANGNAQRVTATGNFALTLSNFGVGTWVLRIIADGTQRNPSSAWDSTIKWAGGTQPTMPTTSGRWILVFLYFDGTAYSGSWSGEYT